MKQLATSASNKIFAGRLRTSSKLSAFSGSKPGGAAADMFVVYGLYPEVVEGMYC